MPKKFIISFVLLVLFTFMGSLKVFSQVKPNIILIMADDLGYETLGAYGGTSYRTPHLDKLALEGMRFNHCYAMPLCTPSRVQIMTGMYNNRNYLGFGLLDPKAKTFGHFMQDAGYKTYIAGKWQLLGNKHQQELAGNRIGTTPEEAGFDDYCLWQINQLGSRYKDPTLTTKNHGVETYSGKYGPDIFLENINSFMEESKASPFFVYYPMVLTHDPFVPTPMNQEFISFDAISKINDPAYFGEMVEYMDMIVGKIIEKVDELGIRENTLIMFVGDNGTDRDVSSSVNGVTVQGNKGQTTDAGTHVPLIANWKGKISPKSINDNLIDFTDFLPTMLEFSGTIKAKDVRLDGLSFYPQLLRENSQTREWIFCHYAPNWGNFEARTYVQNKTWKLYANGEFYNLEKDILEKNPIRIADQSEELRDLIRKFQEVLARYN